MITERIDANVHYPEAIPHVEDVGSKFLPCLNPLDMLKLGVFGGTGLYYVSHRRGLEPMLRKLPHATYANAEQSDPNRNAFGVEAPKRNRANNIPPDIRLIHPGGWFQWYCQYYLGIFQHTTTNKLRIEQWQIEVNQLYGMFTNQLALHHSGMTIDQLWNALLNNPNSINTDVRILIQSLFQYGWLFEFNPKNYGL